MSNFILYLAKILIPKGLQKQLVTTWGKEGLARYARNTGWIFFAKVSMMVISFLTTLYVARHLGPTNFGELSYAISFVGMFSFLVMLGLDSIIYRELASHPEQKNVLLGTALRLRFIAAISTGLICFATAYIISTDAISLILIAILCTAFLFQSYNIILYEFQAAVQSKEISILSIYITFILSILKVTIIYFDQGVIYLAMVLLAESIFYAGGYLYLRKKVFGSISNWYFDINVAKMLLHQSWPLIFSSAFVVIYARIDQIMLKHLVDATAVGLYDAAVRLSEVWYFVPSVMISSLFPAIMNAKKTSFIEYKKRIYALFYLIVFFCIIVSAATSVLAKPIVAIVFGAAFAPSASVLQIYIWAFVPISLLSLAIQILIAEKASKTASVSTLITMILNVSANFILIPLYGIGGAAMATLLSATITIIGIGIFIIHIQKKQNPIALAT